MSRQVSGKKFCLGLDITLLITFDYTNTAGRNSPLRPILVQTSFEIKILESYLVSNFSPVDSEIKEMKFRPAQLFENRNGLHHFPAAETKCMFLYSYLLTDSVHLSRRGWFQAPHSILKRWLT